MRKALPLLLLAGLAWAGSAAPLAAAVEQSGRDTLRICADGNALPYSDEKGQGFENKLAEMIAADLGIPIAYTWFPQSIGFVRNTLAARRCDLVLGTASGEQLMQNTNPYYRSVYALVYRTESGLTATSLADPALKGTRIGVVSQTPPVDLLVRYGLTNVEPYQLAVDTRAYQPARAAIEDVAAGTTDAAVIWGPLAGYWAKQQKVPLTVVPLVADAAGTRLSFTISMGIRPDEPDWKHWLNGWISKNQARIDALLAGYGVPLLDRDGRLLQARPAEPAQYRKSDYRAPVPETLTGATVLATADVVRLLAAEQKPVLLDVLPAEQRPAGRDDGWLPRPHDSIPGAAWLPDVGHGDLTPAQEQYFRAGLQRLTGGRSDTPLLIFCKRDCWMSWNAAKRALDWGYSRVLWYPDGVDGWAEARQPLVPVPPLDGGPQG
ncbi:quinoprotein dehydrogenase-associated putative ABC transporter substrate-binding protein [Oleisolibacter albus]|uniref:quinoprotein dehydrogenase-associated putative ABC transporter substrate-binding protein n=1 Tax=Oleisolibacter albus TaxID=2171757 RepID=UPI000DF2502F|nr:quinoprotein dehydrogenase-associated putative ABC transporter substrate-binding protein [Oleisolibacter albus]